MKSWEHKCPPYMGEEPYVFFAFAQQDRARAWEIMRLLLRRGVRVWYRAGTAGSPEELLLRQKRALGAELTLLLLTDAAVEDRDGKSLILVNQKAGRPIIYLDLDGTDRRLAMGLREGTACLPLYQYPKSEDLEEELIRVPGFRQELLGESVEIGGAPKLWLRRLAAAFTVCAVLLLGISYAGLRWFRWFQPEITDSVIFTDSVIMDAVRTQAGGGALTEEDTAGITVLRLEAAPEGWEDLELLPALERIVLPQQALIDGAVLPEGEYVIELTGGGAS